SPDRPARLAQRPEIRGSMLIDRSGNRDDDAVGRPKRRRIGRELQEAGLQVLRLHLAGAVITRPKLVDTRHGDVEADAPPRAAKRAGEREPDIAKPDDRDRFSLPDTQGACLRPTCGFPTPQTLMKRVLRRLMLRPPQYKLKRHPGPDEKRRPRHRPPGAVTLATS